MNTHSKPHGYLMSIKLNSFYYKDKSIVILYKINKDIWS